jgi:hypothetical protein
VRKAWMVGGAVVIGLSILGTVSAFAVTKSPGLLRPSDLPGGLQQSGPPIAYANPAALLVSVPACTETSQVDTAALGGVEIAFARVGAPTGDVTLVEAVVSYPNAKTAASAFAQRLKDHAARVKCATVGFVRQGVPAGSTPYQGAKFPKIGGGSYLESSGTPGTVNTNTMVRFVSGPYIVALGTFGGTNPLTVAALKTIAPRALRRLPIPTPVPPTTSTTAK